MGHTLITRLDQDSLARLDGIISGTGMRTNKIPYGRGCDRETANRILPYHLTVFHWAKTEDEKYLRRLERFHTPGPFSLSVTGTSIMYHAEEDSALLYFRLRPDQAYKKCVSALEQALQVSTQSFFHMTLAVGKDAAEIERLRQRIDSRAAYPFSLRAEGFDLYHIWKPVRKVAQY